MSQDPTPKVCLELALHEDRQPRAFGVPGCENSSSRRRLGWRPGLDRGDEGVGRGRDLDSDPVGLALQAARGAASS